ncbi:hypothetical protein EPN44_14335 [bacterium]|nr:MAG: hypothetical protein EPN44_14335 [bacterium]
MTAKGKLTPEQIQARARALTGAIEFEDPQFPELGGQAQGEEHSKPKNNETVKPQNHKTVSSSPRRRTAAAQPAADAHQEEKSPVEADPPARPRGERREQSAPRIPAISISLTQADRRRARAIENAIYDHRDTLGLKGKIGPSLLFRMGLELLEHLDEQQLLEAARRNTLYQDSHA